MQLQSREPLQQIMFARYYDDDLPRFMSPDPGESWDEYDPQSWNLYAYVGNNPLRYFDPDGEEMRDSTQFHIGMLSNAQLAGMYGVRDGYFQVAKDQLQRNKTTGEMIVVTEFQIDIASDLTASFAEVKEHEFAHRQDWLDARSELGYNNLDKQLEAAYNDVVAKGKRKGWSADKIAQKAREKADREYKKAYKKILKSYNKKKKQRDPNSHGIDPDGAGPAPNPCDGMGPLCGGAR